ncbi:FMRFamide-related peptides-like isoform X1 [Nylanderia fulva]|uniref:FMRFamide-related peptides-like isoform X1 n=1 Tax=Nylanderia fulva TaxID=613905 RepID=UPI0010FAEB99|nr:FMRFamide-related peptides-like isoform X1 [Nylanderia fulva]
MITLWAFNAMAFLCNWMLVSSSALKDDNSLRIFKESPNEFEYVVKRHDVDDRKEDVESKERRSTMGGSSFIRFGRGFNTMDNSAFDNEIDSKGINRHPRWKSPDVVIRLGRSGNKATNNEQPKRGKNDLNFIRFGRNIQIVPPELDLSAVCSVFMNGAVSDTVLHPDVMRLFRLCNNLNKIAGDISLDTLETDSNHRE